MLNWAPKLQSLFTRRTRCERKTTHMNRNDEDIAIAADSAEHPVVILDVMELSGNG